VDCDAAVIDFRTVHRFFSTARVIFTPKLDDCDIRAEVRLEAGGRYRAITPKDIKEAGICEIRREIGHNAGPGGGIWSAPRGEVRRECFQNESRRRMDAGDRFSVHGGQRLLGWKWTRLEHKYAVIIMEYHTPRSKDLKRMLPWL